MTPSLPGERGWRAILLLYTLLVLPGSCAMPAGFEAMIPSSLETVRKHPKSVRIHVTGGQDGEALGRPHLPNSAFARALAESIIGSQVFSRVIDDNGGAAEYLLTVTLFSLDKRVFGQTVKLEAGWTLQRRGQTAILWQESIVSEHTAGNVKLATEGAARKNIYEGLTRISSINLG